MTMFAVTIPKLTPTEPQHHHPSGYFDDFDPDNCEACEAEEKEALHAFEGEDK